MPTATTPTESRPRPRWESDGRATTTDATRCVDADDGCDDERGVFSTRGEYSAAIQRENEDDRADDSDDHRGFTFATPMIDVNGGGEDDDGDGRNDFVRDAWMRTVETCEARIRGASEASGGRSPTRGIQGEYAKKCAAELALGRVDDAMESAGKCVEAAPFWYKGFVLLAEARMALKTPLAEEARRDLERAAFLEPRARADARFEELAARVIGSV